MDWAGICLLYSTTDGRLAGGYHCFRTSQESHRRCSIWPRWYVFAGFLKYCFTPNKSFADLFNASVAKVIGEPIINYLTIVTTSRMKKNQNPGLAAVFTPRTAGNYILFSIIANNGDQTWNSKLSYL